ncbi:hypothetical protein [Sphingobium sp.]|uniref:hypothetical protein n=1 Tax=Sphingobium sp. TaxID=1912891 RepID=UPI003B3A50DF
MKPVRYGLIAFFCLGALWGVAHMAALPAANGASVPDLPVAAAAQQKAHGNWRLLPVLR